MKYPHPHADDPRLLGVVTYGSHLYGTSTPTSDVDFKGVYLPAHRDLVLSKNLRVERMRFDAGGNVVGDHESMPPNGWEVELTPVQKFVHDYLGGQAYAVELAFAVEDGLAGEHTPLDRRQQWAEFQDLCCMLTSLYLHKNVNGMVGFAVKQTFDYVRRGERYNTALGVLDAVDAIMGCAAYEKNIRLDTKFDESGTVLDEIVKRTGLEIGSTTTAHDKIMRTLKLNGREYLETTALSHFRGAVQKLRDQYGERSTKAAETDVDWKSLSHAVRVYQQVLELLEFGVVTFPRPNAENLLKIKQGQHSLESVKDLLRELDDSVQDELQITALPEVDEAMRNSVDDMLYRWLQRQYVSLGANLNV